ncbi:MAG: hypothetical protein H0U52_08325 [Chloroflexi bacterium]|nr:hypothetical protein [Chloroflexota bacterium]
MANLKSLLVEAAAADPSERLPTYRDAIAAHGAAAITALEPWLADDRLAAFAVRTITRSATEARPEAIAVLTRHQLRATGKAREDLDFALESLGVKPRSTVAGPGALHVIPATAGEDWPGLRAEEFGRVAGTRWRSRDGRTSLAPLITASLRYKHPHFQSYPVERSPELHFALRERYQQGGEHGQGWRAAKLFVYAHALDSALAANPHVSAGLYVEKGDGGPEFGTVDDRWDWSFFVSALDDEHVRDELARAMVRHNLRLGDYVGDRFLPDGAVVGFVGTYDEGELVLRSAKGKEVGRGWDALVTRLRKLPKAEWHDFSIWTSWPAEEGIAAGRSFASDRLIPVLSSLASIYLDIVGPVLPRIASD